MSDTQTDLPAAIREAIEREAEAFNIWARGMRSLYAARVGHEWVIAYGERIARLTLEAERQRQEKAIDEMCCDPYTDPLWGPPPSAELIAEFNRAYEECRRQIAVDAVVEREEAIRRAQRDPAPPREDKEPTPE